MIRSHLAHLCIGALVLSAGLFAPSSRADVVINEIVAGSSDRLLQWSAAGVPKVGTGKTWYAPGFRDGSWADGNGPFGYGNVGTVGTKLDAEMRYLTPTVYLRKSFTVSAADAARTDPLQLLVDYDSGFVAYVNGKELARRNLGPVNGFVAHDQGAYNQRLAGSTEAVTGLAANQYLIPGENLLAIVASNNVNTPTTFNLEWLSDPPNTDPNFLIKPSLRIGGAVPTTLVADTTVWKYFVGLAEPSGGLYDAALLDSQRLRAPWAETTFDDANWASGPSPHGAGTSGLGTTVPGVIGTTPSLYLRILFTATSAEAAEAQALEFLTDYDDGFVAYINGVEVTRANIGNPNEFASNSAVADGIRNRGITQTITLPAAKDLLVAGTNCLAVQVHNVAASDADIYFRGELRTTGASKQQLVSPSATWKYLPGTVEPVAFSSNEDGPSTPDAELDWVELHNTGATTVDLTGWSLSDKANEARQWVFPSVSIAPGGFLVVVCDGRNITTGADYLHTNFSLSRGGEYLALYSPQGTRISSLAPSFPKQSPFHSYGRNATGQWVYLDLPTPGTANAGTEFTGIVATPTVSVPGAFYPGPQNVVFSCATSGAAIRYTLDGSEPTEASTLATSVSITTSRALRVRAFKPGMIPSATITHTYLVNQSAARQSVPAYCLTADEGRALYRPHGIMSIVGGTYGSVAAGVWGHSGNNSAYNNPIPRGRFMERPASFEVFTAGGTEPTLRADIGMRLSGSVHHRGRYLLTGQNGASPNSLSPWVYTNSNEKPSFNLYFRSDYGGDDSVAFPFFPASSLKNYRTLRLRAGKNDIGNPFIRDEWARCLFVQMGQVGAVGRLGCLYVNGVFKGYFNPTERLRDSFFQEAYGSEYEWDVRLVTNENVGLTPEVSSGDSLHYNEMISFAKSNDLATLANFNAISQRVDLTNLIDYILLQTYVAATDWPQNNNIMSRERSPWGKQRFHAWDEETILANVLLNTFSAQLLNTTHYDNGVPCPVLYRQLKGSPEFRTRFADRIQKHFFNGGAFTDGNVTSKWAALSTEFLPLLRDVSGSPTITVTNDTATWVNGVGDPSRYTLSGGTTGSVVNRPSRRRVLFNGYTNNTVAGSPFVPALFTSEGLWPTTVAPVFSQFGGNVASGFALTITNPNAGGTIYYSTDGSDPRDPGGAVAGTPYTEAVTVTQPTLVKARILNGGEWSPLIEAVFNTSTRAQLLITEIHYRPLSSGVTDGDEFEFVEVKNVGSTTVPLAGMKFSQGITCTFPDALMLAPGAFAVLAKNAAAFATRYPGVPVAAEYQPTSLANNGETLTLVDVAGNTLFSVAYSDGGGWPAAADGSGFSLVPIKPDANPAPNDPNQWRASVAQGGSPGANDPLPMFERIYVNEVLTNPAPGQNASIELHNPGTSSVNIGGWFLTNDTALPTTYCIPNNTIIPADGYLIVDEDTFNASPGQPGSFAFGPGENDVWLFAADTTGNLTGWSHGFKVGAADVGTSFARYINSIGEEKFVQPRTLTLGSANAVPAVGPVVITEVMYHPATGGDEFIELRNTSSSPVALYDPARPTNTWRVSGVAFDLPPGIVLGPGRFAIVSQIEPGAFRTKYNVAETIPVLGPYGGSLNNGGEALALQKPGVPYTDATGQTVIPRIDIDRVEYDDAAPWPTAADGGGPALGRFNVFAFADDPANWRTTTASGTPGRPDALTFEEWRRNFFTTAQRTDPALSGPLADFDGDGLVNLFEDAFGTNPLAQDGAALTVGDVTVGDAVFLSLTMRRSLAAGGITLDAEVTSDFSTWSSTEVVRHSATDNGDGTEIVLFRDTTPITPSSPPRYMRARATLAP